MIVRQRYSTNLKDEGDVLLLCGESRPGDCPDQPVWCHSIDGPFNILAQGLNFTQGL